MQTAPVLPPDLSVGIRSPCSSKCLVAPKPRRMVSVTSICNSANQQAINGDDPVDGLVNRVSCEQNLYSAPVSNCFEVSLRPENPTIEQDYYYDEVGLTYDYNSFPTNSLFPLDQHFCFPFPTSYNHNDVSRVSMEKVSFSI
mmetsp:Transcript_33274/g.33892  ORF Transcript_33274/g.33892 Transcript_33274/m.33892 type:complete len:142 (-) Transcript_33274:147-572(-)